MLTMLKIGVSSCFLYPDIHRPYFGPKHLCYLERDMAQYLTRSEVMPILIPDLEEEGLKTFLANLDGFVLQGGSDVCPESYGEEYLNKEKWPGDKYRDDYEFKLIKLALKNKLPIFGICRGFQVLNAYFGGTLVQDINTELETEIEHRNALKYDEIYHNVKLEEGSLLKSIFKTDSMTVNTVHHQCIKKLGKGLKKEATSSEDNIIEAFSKIDDQNKIIAVQWHPEFGHTLGETVLNQDLLYDEFLKLVKVNLKK